MRLSIVIVIANTWTDNNKHNIMKTMGSAAMNTLYRTLIVAYQVRRTDYSLSSSNNNYIYSSPWVKVRGNPST